MVDGPFPCSGKVELFFPEQRASLNAVRKAKALCAGCDYRESCEAGAVARGEQYGIWAGKSHRDLRRARRTSAYAGAARNDGFAALPVKASVPG